MIGPGDLLQCVKQVDDVAPHLKIVMPVVGSIYTVRACYNGYYLNNGEPVPSVYLEEIVNRPVPWNSVVCEVGFPLDCFKPIRKPSIESLKMLAENQTILVHEIEDFLEHAN